MVIFVQWRIQPARHYVEAKKMRKIFERLEMVEGRKLRVPKVPPAGADLRSLADDVVQRQYLQHAGADAVHELLEALQEMELERQGDSAEEHRLFRTAVRFGNTFWICLKCSRK